MSDLIWWPLVNCIGIFSLNYIYSALYGQRYVKILPPTTTILPVVCLQPSGSGKYPFLFQLNNASFVQNQVCKNCFLDLVSYNLMPIVFEWDTKHLHMTITYMYPLSATYITLSVHCRNYTHQVFHPSIFISPNGNTEYKYPLSPSTSPPFSVPWPSAFLLWCCLLSWQQMPWHWAM